MSLNVRLVCCALVSCALGCPDRPLYYPLPDASADLAAVAPADFALPLGPDMAGPALPCTVCAAGKCGTEVTATMSGPNAPDGWSFNIGPNAGSGASYDGADSVAVLNQSVSQSAGSIFYRLPIATDTVDVRFDARIIPAAGQHADGMTFVLVRADSGAGDIYTAVGGAGGSLGMAAATAQNSSTPLSGYGVELDCYDNDNPDSRCGESIRGEHVNIDTLAPCSAGESTLPTPVSAPVAMTLADGQWRTVAIHVENGQMSVAISLDGTTTSVFSGVTLPGFVTGGSYFYGFTGATGLYTERHEIRNISFEFPTARCL